MALSDVVSLPPSADLERGPTGRTPKQVAPTAPAPQRRVLGIGVVLVAGGLAIFARSGGARIAVTFGVGLLLGVVLFHSRFGFTSAWRQLVAVGQGRALRAQMLMLGTATVLFAPILATGVGLFGTHPQGYVNPVGTSVALGAFIFAIGMQIGGACASGTLYTVGSGQGAIVLTLFGFVFGSLLATWPFMFFTKTLPNGPVVSLAASRLGYGGAVVVQLLAFAAIAGISVLVARRRRPPANRARRARPRVRARGAGELAAMGRCAWSRGPQCCVAARQRQTVGDHFSVRVVGCQDRTGPRAAG